MAISFARRGVVSIWIGQKLVEPGSDFLRDGFGVDYYDLDDQECIIGETASPVRELAERLSYAESFLEALVQRAGERGVSTCLWVFAQYDFQYDADKAGVASVPTEPLFIGDFEWHE